MINMTGDKVLNMDNSNLLSMKVNKSLLLMAMDELDKKEKKKSQLRAISIFFVFLIIFILI